MKIKTVMCLVFLTAAVTAQTHHYPWEVEGLFSLDTYDGSANLRVQERIVWFGHQNAGIGIRGTQQWRLNAFIAGMLLEAIYRYRIERFDLHAGLGGGFRHTAIGDYSHTMPAAGPLLGLSFNLTRRASVRLNYQGLACFDSYTFWSHTFVVGLGFAFGRNSSGRSGSDQTLSAAVDSTFSE